MDPSFLHADSENSDQTGSSVFAGCKDHFVGFVMRRLKSVLLVAIFPGFLLMYIPDNAMSRASSKTKKLCLRKWL